MSQRLSSINKDIGFSVAGSVVQFTDAVKLLGITLDSVLVFDKHATNVVRQSRIIYANCVISDHC